MVNTPNLIIHSNVEQNTQTSVYQTCIAVTNVAVTIMIMPIAVTINSCNLYPTHVVVVTIIIIHYKTRVFIFVRFTDLTLMLDINQSNLLEMLNFYTII